MALLRSLIKPEPAAAKHEGGNEYEKE